MQGVQDGAERGERSGGPEGGDRGEPAGERAEGVEHPREGLQGGSEEVPAGGRQIDDDPDRADRESGARQEGLREGLPRGGEIRGELSEGGRRSESIQSGSTWTRASRGRAYQRAAGSLIAATRTEIHTIRGEVTTWTRDVFAI